MAGQRAMMTRPARAAGLVALGVAAAVAHGTAARAADEPPAAPEQAAPAAPEAASQGFASWFDPSKAPFLPIPEIDVGPQSGLTVGLIPTLLRTNRQEQIDLITAPDIIHSQYFGWGARMRMFGYPSADAEWSVVGGLKERIEREFDARYATGLTHADAFTWSVEAIYDRSGTARFFGIGNDSLRQDQTTFIRSQGRVDASIGWNLTRALQLSYVARLRQVEVLPGVLPGLPSIQTLFPALDGLAPQHQFEQLAIVAYDTRDAKTIPASGGSILVYAGVASRALGSAFADTSFGIEAHQYWSLQDDLRLAVHGTLRYMPSAAAAPFWALSSMGGDRSLFAEREPLRAYGDDRFIDRNLFSSGVELRTRVAGFDAFSTHISLELAPFIDVGKVFATPGESPVSHLHTAGGLGIRGVASPFVVGYVDIGYGREGVAVFSGINYPF